MTTRTGEQHTAATKHQGWDAIVAEIEKRFEHMKTVQPWCIDAVSAHLLGVHERARHTLLCLGEYLARVLVEICTKHGVNLDTVQVQHVKS